MSIYSKQGKIDGIAFGTVIRGISNGSYIVIFERENASLEQIEAIKWNRPKVEGKTILPKDYGFHVEGISYSSSDHCYRVTVTVAQQYLGDVTEYRDIIDGLREDKRSLSKENTAKQAEITSLEQQLADADEAAIALYEQIRAQAETTTDTGEEETA